MTAWIPPADFGLLVSAGTLAQQRHAYAKRSGDWWQYSTTIKRVYLL
jgi:hypothetical protein